MKISFDFDSTLTQGEIQRLARTYVEANHEVWIVTSRLSTPNWNFDLRVISKNLGIPPERVHYTEGDYKWQFLHENDFEFHFDDDYMEIKTARINNCKCIVIPVWDPFDEIEKVDE